MSDLFLFSGIMLISVFASSVSQIMLKKASEKVYMSRLKEYLNFMVIFAYILFFASTMITVLSLKYLPLSFAPVLEAAGYIYVAVLSRIFLQERLKRKQIMGMLLIICGIVIYSFNF